MSNTCNTLSSHARFNQVTNIDCYTSANIFHIVNKLYVAWCSTDRSIFKHEKVVLIASNKRISHDKCWRRKIATSITVYKKHIFFVWTPNSRSIQPISSIHVDL